MPFWPDERGELHRLWLAASLVSSYRRYFYKLAAKAAKGAIDAGILRLQLRCYASPLSILRLLPAVETSLSSIRVVCLLC